MNETFFVIASILLIGAIILSKIFCNRRANAEIRDEIENAKRNAESTKTRIDESKKCVERIESGIGTAQESTERITDSNRIIEQSVEESQRIFEEIRKQRIEE